MYVILGAPQCKYCNEAKKVLQGKSYKYVDLTTIYGTEGWRKIFSDIPAYIGQRTIPLVFVIEGDRDVTVNTHGELMDVISEATFVGGFIELIDHLESQDLAMDGDY